MMGMKKIDVAAIRPRGSADVQSAHAFKSCMALTKCGATYGLRCGLSAWRADRRVFGLERFHDERDRKEDAKQHKRHCH